MAMLKDKVPPFIAAVEAEFARGGGGRSDPLRNPVGRGMKAGPLAGAGVMLTGEEQQQENQYFDRLFVCQRQLKAKTRSWEFLHEGVTASAVVILKRWPVLWRLRRA